MSYMSAFYQSQVYLNGIDYEFIKLSSHQLCIKPLQLIVFAKDRSVHPIAIFLDHLLSMNAV